MKKDTTLTLTRDECGRIMDVLSDANCRLEDVLALPRELVTHRVVRKWIERDATLFAKLPKRLQTRSMLRCAMSAYNFCPDLCPLRLLDADICERHFNKVKHVRGIPASFITEAMCVKAAAHFMGTMSIPSHMFTDTVVEAVISVCRNTDRLEYMVMNDANLRRTLLDYIVGNRNEVSAGALKCVFDVDAEFSDAFYSGDMHTAMSIMNTKITSLRGDYYPNRYNVAMLLLLAAGERDEFNQSVSDYLCSRLDELREFLVKNDLSLGPNMERSLSNALECAHAL